MAFKLSNLLNPVTEPNSPSAPEEAQLPSPKYQKSLAGGPGAGSDSSERRYYDNATGGDHAFRVESSENIVGPGGVQDAAKVLAYFASGGGGRSRSRSGSFAGGTLSAASPDAVRRASSGASEKPRQELEYFQGPQQQSPPLQQLQVQQHHQYQSRNPQSQTRLFSPLATFPQQRKMPPAASELSSPVLPPLRAPSPDRVADVGEHPHSSTSTSSHSSEAIQVRYTPQTQKYTHYNQDNNTGETTESDSIAGADEDDEEDEDELPIHVSGTTKARGRGTGLKPKGKPRKPAKRQTSHSRAKSSSPHPINRARSSTTPSTTAHTPNLTSGAASKKPRGTAKSAPRKKGVAKLTKKKRRTGADEEQQDTEEALLDFPPPIARRTRSRSPAINVVNAYEGQDVYCICRKPDSGKWMIGCDGCDDWFHGECIKIEEIDGDLVDKYFCPSCTAQIKGVTSWKRKCRLQSCRKPAAVTDSPPSKYCCQDHGITFYEQQILRSTLTKHELATIVASVSNEKEFRQLGDKVPTPPLSEDEDEGGDGQGGKKFYDRYPEDRDRLRDISKEKNELEAKKLLIDGRMRYITFTRERRERLIEELKQEAIAGGEFTPAKSSGKGAKGGGNSAAKFDICGYDSRLSWDDVEWEEWWMEFPLETKAYIQNSAAGHHHHPPLPAPARDQTPPQTSSSASALTSDLDSREMICLKRKCQKHNLWYKVSMEEVELEERLWEERMGGLKNEERKIRERMKRRWYATKEGSGRGREGWVVKEWEGGEGVKEEGS